MELEKLMKFTTLLIVVFSLSLFAKDYTKKREVTQFIDMMSQKHNFKKSSLKALLNNVEVQKEPLMIYGGIKRERTQEEKNRLKKKYPKYGSWDRYVKYKVTPTRVKDGVSFIKKYNTTFKRVEEEYGVPAEYIAAIVGVESAYGKNVGKYPVFDTLTTLAFEKNRRNKFFKKQLEEFIILSDNHNINPKNVQGSHSGAIGLGQFIPSSYKHFGVDFNKDGKVSLQHPQDAIASIANYLDKNGWRRGEEVATRVSYKGKRFKKYKTGYSTTYERRELKGITPKYAKWDYHKKVRLIKLNKENHDELWYGAKNFYVITRYNHSTYYAMSIHQLAQKIKESIS